MSTKSAQLGQIWCGLRVVGGPALTELIRWPGDPGPPDIEFVHCGHSDYFDLMDQSPRTLLCRRSTKNEWQISLPNLAAAKIRDGIVEYTCLPKSDPTELKPFIYGPVLSMCGMQIGLLPIRGTVVEGSRGGALLCGASGVGKSAVAAALINKGLRLVSDGTCILELSKGSGSAFARATHPWIHIWRRGAFSIGLDINTMSKWRAGVEKYSYLTPDPFGPLRNVPIKQIVVIQRAAAKLGVKAIESAESAAHLLKSSVERQFGLGLIDKEWSNAIGSLSSFAPVYTALVDSDQFAADSLAEILQ